MIYSMTGYGRSEIQRDGFSVRVEIRSVNSRFLDLALKTSRILFDYENELKDLIKNKIHRGRITLQIVSARDKDGYETLQLDKDTARAYLEMLRKLSSELELDDTVTLNHLLSFNDIFVPPEGTEEIETLLEIVRETVSRAIDDLQTMKRAEGAELAKDLKNRLTQLEKTIDNIEVLAKDVPVEALQRLKERVSKLTLPENLEPNRLEFELALMADKLDVTEECVRLRSHVQLFQNTINSSEPASGKRLGFILQEMNREANTLGSKSNNIDISHLTVNIKEEIERIREQVQNIE
jgi:uncharacterized protein (TIGR00255 family)